MIFNDDLFQKNKQPIRTPCKSVLVAWTGGLDSTYLVWKFISLGFRVIPVYTYGLQYSVDLPKKINDILGPHNILIDAEILFRILGGEKGAKDNIVNKLSTLFEDWKE